MIHVVHVSDDVRELSRFYEDVFGGLVYMGVDEPNFLPIEDRWAQLVQISDLCVEPMAPNVPVDGSKPVGKFYNRFGRHLHSVGFLVDDLAGLGNHLIEEGVYIGRPGGGPAGDVSELNLPYFYPSPRDTRGLLIEFSAKTMPNDPRLLDTWSSQRKLWETGHPLTVHRLGFVTLGLRDVTAATDVYLKQLQARSVHEGTDDDEQCRFHTVQLGDCLIRLAEPIDGSAPLGEHVERWGNTIYSITLNVRDLDSARAWLTRHGIATELLRPSLLAANPADCFGAPYFFTTEQVPSDPLEV
jgi:hypothetical protein